MNIPESIRIGGVEYAVTYEPFLSMDGRELCGMIDYQQNVISLSENVGMSHERQCLTLWHEIMHGVLNHFDLDLEDEERVVEIVARGVYQVLQDNMSRLFGPAPSIEMHPPTTFVEKERNDNEDWQLV